MLFVNVYILSMANFSQIVQDLVEAGLSEMQIADAVDASQPTINRIKLGKQKNIAYDLGYSLICLRSRTRSRRSPKSKEAA
jgi:hypothetical protein